MRYWTTDVINGMSINVANKYMPGLLDFFNLKASAECFIQLRLLLSLIVAEMINSSKFMLLIMIIEFIQGHHPYRSVLLFPIDSNRQFTVFHFPHVN